MERFLLLIIILLLHLTPTLANTDKALLEIVINGQNVGVYAVILKKDDVIIPVSAFKNWRIKKQLWVSQGDNVSLLSLAPHLQYSFDNNTANLIITVKADSFEPQIIESSSRYTPYDSTHAILPEPWSAFLNYALDANFSQPEGFDTLSTTWEVGITSNQWFLFSDFSSNYSSFDQSSTTRRNNTFLQWENTRTRQKITLGDIQLNSPTLSTSGKLGGILWQSNFRRYGQFQFMPSFDMNFNVETPSHAEFYVNDIKTKEWDLLPGTVSLPSLLTNGQGNATLVLTDAFGREQLISQPFYITQQLLKEGLHDFSYGLGAKRTLQSNKLFDYGDMVLFGSHRYGFNNNLTAGGAFTLSDKTTNLGISVTTSFSGHSLIDTAVTMSNQNSLTGYLALIRYQFNHDYINLAINGGFSSKQYGNLYSDAASLQKNKYRINGSINYRIPFIRSSIGASLSQTTSWSDSTKNRSLSLFYRQQIYKTLTLNAQVNHDLNTGNNIASLHFSYTPQVNDSFDILKNNNLSYQLDYDDKTHVDTQTWQTQKRGNIGEGYNYTAALQKKDKALSGFARYQYKNNNGIYRANYSQNEQTIAGNIGVAGSLSTVNNELFFGRPITDSFAVVKVKGTATEIPIYNDGAFLGNASENKSIVIPNIQSRRFGKMNIKPADINLDLTADNTEKILAVGIRSGHMLEFTLHKFIAVEGNAYILRKDGSKKYLEALPIEYKAKGKIKNSFTGKKGFFYLENVPTGKFHAIVKRYPSDCVLQMTIPKSNKVVAKVGDILCKLKSTE